MDTETGELQERRLRHPEEAEKFYRDLWERKVRARVGMEASGHARWFERLLAELSLELWIGDAAHGAEGGDLAVLPGLAVSRQRLPRIIRGASGRSWGFRLFQRVEIEDHVFDALVAQVSFERRHDAASPRQYRGANNIVRGGSPAGKELAVENAMQVRRNLSRGEPSPAVAAVAVHFE